MDTVPLAEFGIQTRPSRVITPEVGRFPTLTVATTLFVAGSSCVIVPLPLFVVQSCSPFVANPSGAFWPTSIFRNVFVAGSIRKTNVSSMPFEPTQTAPPNDSKFAGDPPVRSVATTLFFAGSMRATVPSRLFDAQTDPNANHTSHTFSPTLIRLTTLSVFGLTRSMRDVPYPSIHSEPAPWTMPHGPPPTLTAPFAL